MDLVTSSALENGYITHKLADGTAKVYNAVRMGVAWPTEYSKAYLCVFGQLYNYRKVFGDTLIGPIRQIAEREVETLCLTDVFNGIMDLCKTLWCEEVYADMAPANTGYVEGFRDYCNALDYARPWPAIQEAPFADNFQFGLGLASDWLKYGRVKVDEDGILVKQLDSFNVPTKENPTNDLENKPERRFNAINAYRYVLGAFQRNPVSSAELPKYVKKAYYSQT